MNERYKRAREQEKAAEPKQKRKVVETGKIGLIVKVAGLTDANAATVSNDVRHTLENCARLNLLDEFSTERKVEYREILEEDA